MKDELNRSNCDLRATPVEITCAGLKLAGEWAVPQRPTGLVLFAHGSGSSRQSPRNQFVAQALQRAGLATLLFDLLTSEEEARDNVTLTLRFNIEFLAERLLQATKWAQQRPEVERLRLSYFGASTGGAAALVAAAKLGVGIAAVVARGGRPDLALAALKRVQAPTLLIVGERDTVVLDLNRSAYSQLECAKQLEIVPGASHLFEEPGALEQVAALSAAWFVRHCRAG